MAFHQAELVLDNFGRPVFILPEELPAGDCRISVYDESVDFSVSEKNIGDITGILPEVIAWLATHEQAGIIVYHDDSKPCPKQLTHVAAISDLRGEA